jgi:hypothetical protein
MSIGATILTTAVGTPGATVTTLTKAKSGLYTYVDGSQVPSTMTLKAANPSSLHKTCGIVYKINPGILDSFPDTKSGKISVSIQLNLSLGSVVTDSVAQAFASEAGTVLSQTAILTALLGGSLE